MRTRVPIENRSGGGPIEAVVVRRYALPKERLTIHQLGNDSFDIAPAPLFSVSVSATCKGISLRRDSNVPEPYGVRRIADFVRIASYNSKSDQSGIVNLKRVL